MEFLTDEELAAYYGKPAAEISPTDTPQSDYICGDETTDCEECGAVLDVRCVAFDEGHSGGYVEVAYCESCEVEHRRTRAPVCTDLDYQSGTYRTDEREEYVCSDCRQRHPITKPTGEFETTSTPGIRSHEIVTISCPCGERLVIDGVEFPEERPCSSCSRTYSFEIEQC